MATRAKPGSSSNRSIGGYDALDMVVGEKALGAFAGDFVHGVDEEDLALAFLGLGRAADDDAGLHGRVVEEVRPQAEDALDQVGLDQFAAASPPLPGGRARHAERGWRSGRVLGARL